jgi:hypothetical protein
MNKFLDAIETVHTWIVGNKRNETERRTKKSKRKKTTKRRAVRRKRGN